jgi:hypothetical protein
VPRTRRHRHTRRSETDRGGGNLQGGMRFVAAGPNPRTEQSTRAKPTSTAWTRRVCPPGAGKAWPRAHMAAASPPVPVRVRSLATHHHSAAITRSVRPLLAKLEAPNEPNSMVSDDGPCISAAGSGRDLTKLLFPSQTLGEVHVRCVACVIPTAVATRRTEPPVTSPEPDRSPARCGHRRRDEG